MSFLPWIKPIRPPEPENANPVPQQQVDTATQFSPVVQELMAHNPYMKDLGIIDPTLAQYNAALADRTGQVALIEETSKLLKEHTELDQKELSAKTAIHETLSKHQQFLAKNANKLQLINQQHVLGMAGLQQQQQSQKAAFNGLAAARAAIANRMRGGAA